MAVGVEPEGQAGRGRGQQVLDEGRRQAERGRPHALEIEQGLDLTAVRATMVGPAAPARKTARPPWARCSRQGAGVAVEREVDDAALALLRHGGHVGVGGVEHGEPVGQHHVQRRANRLGRKLARIHVQLAQVVAGTEIRDHRDLAAIEGQAFADHPALRGFDDHGVDEGIDQQAAGAGRVGGSPRRRARAGRRAVRASSPGRPCATRPKAWPRSSDATWVLPLVPGNRDQRHAPAFARPGTDG